MKGFLRYLKYVKGKDEYFLKIFSNWFKKGVDNIRVIRKKGGGEEDVDVGMFFIDVWRNDIKIVYIGLFYWF